MHLISIKHKSEGETIVLAILSMWWTVINYGFGPTLRVLGAALVLPVPVYGRYEDFCSGGFYKGWRLAVVAIRLGFVRGDKRKPRISLKSWLHPVGKQQLVATWEQIQDGMVI